MKEQVKLLVSVATTVIATNIACQLFKRWHKQTSNHPEEGGKVEDSKEAMARQKAIEVAGVHEPQKLFGTYYFLRGDLEQAKSYYKIKDEL